MVGTPDRQTVFVASHPDLPRVYSQGGTVDEALEGLAEVRAEDLRDMQVAKVDVPPPKAQPHMRIVESEP
jgi:predicted RNase H-like HicB family nuclease